MIVPINWLKEFVDIESASETIEILARAGFEAVEIKSSQNFEGVVVAQVLKVTPISGTKLKTCLVSDGKSISTVVCGAENVQKGQIVPYAKDGAVLPGGIKISKRKIRGVVSNGMICSEKELGLGEDAKGIMVLEGNFELGKPFSAKKQALVDVEITANRGDCLSVFGIAREISIFSKKELKNPQIPSLDMQAGEVDFSVELADPNCPYYTGCIIEGVEVKESPNWIKEKLKSMGLNPQNNIVDITNLILFELGQPTHAFDLDKLQGRKIVVSPSRSGEKIKLLDGKDYILPEGVCLIRDSSNAVAVGGVMGGESTGVLSNTKRVFVESAFFNPEAIYRAIKKLRINSDAAMRFSRGVDPCMVRGALLRVAYLIGKVAGGKVVGFVEKGAPPDRPEIKIKRDRISNFLGFEIPFNDFEKALASCAKVLQRNENDYTIKPLSHRGDLKIEQDIAEEVARIYGYENIPPSYPQIRRMPYGKPDTVKFREKIICEFIKHGFNEVVTCDMISDVRVKELKNVVRIQNPLSSDMNVLRPIFLPSLLDVLRRNVSRGLNNVRIFECGKVFKKKDERILEEEQIAGIITGQTIPLSHYQREKIDFFYVKGILETILKNFTPLDSQHLTGFTSNTLKSEVLHFPFLKLAYRFKGERVLFLIGEVADEVLSSFDIKKDFLLGDVFYFEFYFKNISEREKIYTSPPVVPYVVRDLSIVVDEKIKYERIFEKIYKAHPQFLSRFCLIDIYRGPQVGEGKKSLSFRFFFQGKETLLQSDVEKQIQKILNLLSKEFGAKLREK